MGAELSISVEVAHRLPDDDGPAVRILSALHAFSSQASVVHRGGDEPRIAGESSRVSGIGDETRPVPTTNFRIRRCHDRVLYVDNHWLRWRGMDRGTLRSARRRE